MIDTLAAAVTLYAFGLALATLIATIRPTRPRLIDIAFGGLGVAVVVQAVGDVATLVRGHRPGEPAVHLAYLVFSVLVVPLTLAAVRSDRGRWATLLCAGAALMIAVVVVRMQTTWRPGRA